ncbi:MAG: Sensor histidine kinase TmoS [Pseudomonadota bacterium]
MFASLVVITGLKLSAFDYIGAPSPFLLYFVSIITAAWVGGMSAGVVITILSAALTSYFFMVPYYAIRIENFETVVQLAVFLFEGLSITAITARLRSERMRADDAVRKSQYSVAKLEGVLHSVTDGITVQSAEGQLIFANDAAARITGFPSAQALLAAPTTETITGFEVLNPDGSPYPLAELPGRIVLQGRPAAERLLRFRILATGIERWTLVRATGIRIADDPVQYAVNVFQDVTEARREQEVRRLREEWFSTTLRSIADAVITTDAQGKITFMNPPAEKLTGWSARSADGKSLQEVFNVVDEDTRAPLLAPEARMLQEPGTAGISPNAILLRPDGTESSIDESIAPIHATQAEAVGMVLVFRDVSERRADDRRRAFLARASAELNASLDYKQTLASVAQLAVPTIADFCTVDIVEHGQPKRLAVAHVDPAKAEAVLDIMRSFPVDTGKPVFVPNIPETMLLAAASDDEHLERLRTLQLRSFITVPLEAYGRVIGVVELAMAESGREYGPKDLTLALALAERASLAIHNAHLYAEATEARRNAERASRTKDEFLAMLGHELRNPLAPITTAIELMKLTAPASLDYERAIIERQVKHLVRLVDDLLDVSRSAHGKFLLVREEIEVIDIVTSALQQVDLLLEERRHHISTTVPKGLWVSGDRVRMLQVFSNLLMNAAKYTEPGGQIEISARREADLVHITVKDNGVGIAPELLPHVFEVFVQASQSIERTQGGLGLGLAIVRNVVELHGGKVFAHSLGAGRGSEFRVELPSSNGDSASVPIQTVTTSTVPSGIKVLMVDDNEDALDLLHHALSLAGYDAHTAYDGAEALRLAEQLKPDIALLDIGLPGMDGYELARRLRTLPFATALKLVAITGYGQPSDRERTHAAGFDEHLVKPVLVDQVKAVLERLLGIETKR